MGNADILTQKKEWHDVFFDALKKSFNVAGSAKAAGVARQYVYQVRSENVEFARRWEDAIGHSLETAEGELYRRSVHGVLKPVYQNGKEVGKIREYSDTLLIFLLKSHKPDRYNPPIKQEHTGAGGDPIKHESMVNHAIDGKTAQTVLEILVASGAITTGVDPAEDDAIHSP